MSSLMSKQDHCRIGNIRHGVSKSKQQAVYLCVFYSTDDNDVWCVLTVDASEDL